MSKSQYNPHLELPPESPSQQFPSVYPKVPTQDEPPSYDSTYQYNMPQPSSQSQPLYPQYRPPPSQQQQQQYTQPPQQQYQPPSPHIQQQQPQYIQQQFQHQHSNRPAMVYGSIAPPNLNAPLPPQQPIQPITALRTNAELVQCPHCRQYVQTVIDYESGLCTGLSVGGLFLAGCHSGGCLVPFLFPWTKDVSHICPSCKQKIATFTRLERDTRITASPQ